VVVVRELAADLPLVVGDPDGLQQVVLNLLLNAIQAMPQGGRLTIRGAGEHRRKGGLDLAPPQHYAVITIEDTGEGIDADARAKIFDPFYSTKSDGTGLGLTVVHGIVKQHDGWIEVDAAQPRGTAFRVYLPADVGVNAAADADADANADADADADADAAPGGGAGADAAPDETPRTTEQR
jgi:two-component system cell cycle sensor histidine kinase/response regulator CckA